MLQGQEVRTVLNAKGYIELDDSMMIVYGVIPTGRISIKGRLEIEHAGRYMLVQTVDFKHDKKVLHGYNEHHAYYTVPLELDKIKVLSYDENFKSVTTEKSKESTLKFDRVAECDFCGKKKDVAITKFGTSGYNRLICNTCYKEAKEQAQLFFKYNPFENEEIEK